MADAASKTHSTLTYAPVDGYVHHWLTLGPHDQRVAGAPHPHESADDFARRMLAHPSQAAPDFARIVELDRVRLGERDAFWEMATCAPDHLLAWHGFLPHYTHRQAWGFVQLHSERAQETTLICHATGALRLWLNGELLVAGAARAFAPVQRQEYRFAARLQSGANPLLVRLEAVGAGACSLSTTLRVETNGDTPVKVQLPTVTRAPRRRQRLDAVFAQTRLDRVVYTKSDPIRLLAPPRPKNVQMQLRLQKPNGAIYAETLGTLRPNETIESVRGSQLPDGRIDAVVMAPFAQFYNEALRAQRRFPILIANQPFTTQPPAPDDPAQKIDARLIELLRRAADHEPTVYGELAKMAFGWWERVDETAIDLAMQRAVRGDADSLAGLMGLITMAARMPAYRGFPQTLLPSLLRGLAASVEPENAAWDAGDEATALAWMAARYLIRQLQTHPPHTQEASSQEAGAQEASSQEAGALVAWMARRGQTGFRHWHSDYELLVCALAPLASLAHSEDVREMAAALLDTLMLGLALHNFRGVFGATRSRTGAACVRSGRFAPEASLMRLLWGVGGYAEGLGAAVALALATGSYTLPAAIRAMAQAQPDALWVLERHGDAPQSANIATLRTPDYLLTSAQDYRAGAPGTREHIWQATLGPEALIFSTHPGSYSQEPWAAPGWWVGNGVLPRVAQHHDALIAFYALPQEDSIHKVVSFTHAHFPIYAFDEHRMVEGWAFARVGSGYVALGALPGFVQAEDGPDAGCELRAPGRISAWLCQMGRAATDGDFAAFQHKVLATAPRLDGERVVWTTVRGDTLALGVDGPFTVNGQRIGLDAFPRHHSVYGHAPFPAQHLELVVGEDALRLHF